MILYFSATGNSLKVAQTIATATDDTMVDVGRAYKTGKLDFYVEQGENLGFVFPVYAWSTPRIIDQVLKKCHFITSNGNPYTPGYCYCVMTCGSTAGGTGAFFEKMLMKYVGLRLDASFSVKSVGNCVMLYNPLEGVKLRERLNLADKQAAEVAQRVSEKKLGSFVESGFMSKMASKMAAEDRKQVDVSAFSVAADRCDGCGICEAVCPTNTVHIQNGYPVWIGDDCTQCLACLHRCPQWASQNGEKTKGRGRYLNPILRGHQVKDPFEIPTI